MKNTIKRGMAAAISRALAVVLPQAKLRGSKFAQMRILIPITIIAVIGFFAACGGGGGGGPTGDPLTGVYIAGFNNGTAVYWKDGVPQTLNGSTDGYARAIAVSGSSVYVAGRNNNTAVYWKDDELKTLTGATSGSYARAIAVSGSSVYVAGINNNTAVYWVNNVSKTLTGAVSGNSQVYGIVVVDN